MIVKKVIPFLSLLAFAVCGTAHAQKVRAADTGAVELALLGTENTVGHELTLKKGDVLWAETFRPLHIVVLKDDVEERRRPNVDGIPAETTLIGVRLASGLAYCPAIDYDAPVSKVQCFQDFNDDGLFEGGYYSDQRGFDTQFLAGWLRGLSGLTKQLSYAPPTEETVVPTGRLSVQYDGMRKGAPKFRVYVENERIDDPLYCDVTEPGECEILGRRIRYVENDDGTVSFTPVDEGTLRGFSLQSVSSYRK